MQRGIRHLRSGGGGNQLLPIGPPMADEDGGGKTPRGQHPSYSPMQIASIVLLSVLLVLALAIAALVVAILIALMGYAPPEILAQPSLQLLASYTSNRATTTSFVAVAGDGSYIFAVPMGLSQQTPSQNGSAPALATLLQYIGTNTLNPVQTITIGATLNVTVGAGVSRNFALFVTAEADLTAPDSNGQQFNNAVFIQLMAGSLTNVIATRCLHQPNSGVADTQKGFLTFSWTDDGNFVSFATGATNTTLGALTGSNCTIHIAASSTLEDVVTLQPGSGSCSGGDFFSVYSSTASAYLDYLAVATANLAQTTSTLSIYRFTRTPSYALTLVTSTALPQLVNDLHSRPYSTPRSMNSPALYEFISVGTQTAVTASEPSLLQSPPATFTAPNSGSELIVYAFDTNSMATINALDLGRPVWSTSLMPNGQGQSILIATSPRKGSTASIIGFRVFALSIAAFGSDYGAGDSAKSVAVSADSRYAVSGTSKGSDQSYSGTYSTGSFAETALYKVVTIVV